MTAQNDLTIDEMVYNAGKMIKRSEDILDMVNSEKRRSRFTADNFQEAFGIPFHPTR